MAANFGAGHIVYFLVQYACAVGKFAAICLGAVCFMMRTCEHDKTNAD